MVEATDLPLNADFENGFGADAAAVADSVRLAVETGVAGLSIEDSTGRAATPLFPVATATERVRAARRAIDAAGGDTLLVARAECFLVGKTDIDEVIARLRAYADVGADCLYAPGIKTPEHIAALVKAVAPKPVNVLIGAPSDFSLTTLAELGVRRVSVGGALARAAWGGFQRAAQSLAEGRFDGLAGAPSHGNIDTLFGAPPAPEPCHATHADASRCRAPSNAARPAAPRAQRSARRASVHAEAFRRRTPARAAAHDAPGKDGRVPPAGRTRERAGHTPVPPPA